MEQNEQINEEHKEVEVNKEQPEQKEQPKTFTEEEVAKMVQSEADRRVTQALQKKQEQWEQDFKSKLEAEKSEAEKLAKMSEEERYKAELAKEREAFEQERKEFRMMQLENETIKQLNQSGLPVDFAAYLMADSAEEIQSNIAKFHDEWSKAIQKEVDERLKGRSPKVPSTQAESISKEDFAKMNIYEKQKLYEENPALYEQLKR